MACSDEPMPLASLISLQLDLPPSCVEFCPAHPSYFLVGTYNLQKDEDAAAAIAENADAESDDDSLAEATVKTPQSRNGSIIVYKVEDDKLIHIQTKPQPSALLDLHFNPHACKHDICGVVSSTGTLAMFKLDPSGEQPLKHLKTMDMATMSKDADGAIDTDTLFTSFCWHPTRADMVAITTSAGHVYLVDLGVSEGSWVLYPEPIITHTLEAWTVSISPFLGTTTGQPYEGLQKNESSFGVYSGGDDSALRYQRCTLGAADADDETQHPVDITSHMGARFKGHEAGVTAILPLCLTKDGAELVITGSYDDHIRLFSISAQPYGPSRAEILAKSNLGGGVWRLKLIDLDDGIADGHSWRARLLVSCMHAGARIVELIRTADGKYQFRTIGRFEEHKSMNYGSDLQPGWTEDLSIVSTSFYDKLLCLWKFNL
ncbi:hypothetical protein B0T17DRAFT_620946 [Bombardia bombarda]|uniref:Uncharacterized protein n=1 Tax=Bombardia bombarda TaxID=252184 RepID=A0AA39U3Y3_9PEZI|nr:hypothetical protein B0T17DRAFT_620946 [Bombardia bombarda]